MTLKRLVKENSLSTSHMTGKAWNVGLRFKRINNPRALKDILIKGIFFNTNSLRKRLIKEQILNDECSRCKVKKWMDSELSLELDHIDGDRTNNLIENLRILCPNCHSLTNNYRGRNKKRYLYKSFEEQSALIGESVYPGGLNPPALVSHPSSSLGESTKKFCQDCNKNIYYRSARCKPCAGKLKSPTKITWPSKEEILERLKTSNYSRLGKELGVSDNAIRKYLKR